MGNHGDDDAETAAGLRSRKLWDMLRARLEQSHAIMMARYHVPPEGTATEAGPLRLTPRGGAAGRLRPGTARPARKAGAGPSILRGR